MSLVSFANNQLLLRDVLGMIAESDALLARLRRTEDLVIGKADSEQLAEWRRELPGRVVRLEAFLGAIRDMTREQMRLLKGTTKM